MTADTRSIVLDGDVFTGTDLEIVQAMRSASFIASSDVRSYARAVLERARELEPDLTEVELPEDISDAEVAARLLSALVEAGLAAESVTSPKK
jgi:hypothetical protein